MKKIIAMALLICTVLASAGCAELTGFGTVHMTEPEKYGKWERYHEAPSFLPETLDTDTVNAYSYTLYSYFDVCYEIFLDITVSQEQFGNLIERAKQYSDVYTETAADYAEGYTEIVFSDAYQRGELDEYDGLEQVGTAAIDKVIYRTDTCNIIYVSFHADDTGVYDVENVAYFNRFSILPEEYVKNRTTGG